MTEVNFIPQVEDQEVVFSELQHQNMTAKRRVELINGNGNREGCCKAFLLSNFIFLLKKKKKRADNYSIKIQGGICS